MLGKFLKGRRKAARLSQTKLAKATGIPQTYISRIERGEVGLPHRATREKFHAALGTTEREWLDAAGIDHRAWTALAERRKRYASLFGRLEITEQEYEEARADLAAEEAALVAVGTPGRDFADLSRALPRLGALPPERANWYCRQAISRVEMLSKAARRVVWMPDAAAAFTGCD